MIVADTGAIIALIDADDHHHDAILAAFEDDPEWVLPWAILPEVDYLLLHHVGVAAEAAFVRDLADGAYTVEWGDETDIARTGALCEQYSSLHLGLVDAVVVAIAERLRADAIATLDLRDFGPLVIRGAPRLIPRDR